MAAFEAGEQNVESVVEFGGSVVLGEFAGEAAEEGELPRRQVVEAEPAQVVGLGGVDGEWLEFDEDVPVEEAEVEALEV